MCDSNIEERLVAIEGKLTALLDKIDAAWWPSPSPPWNVSPTVPWYCTCIPYIDAAGNRWCTCGGTSNYQWTTTTACVEKCQVCSKTGKWYLFDSEAVVHLWLCEECYNGQNRVPQEE